MNRPIEQEFDEYLDPDDESNYFEEDKNFNLNDINPEEANRINEIEAQNNKEDLEDFLRKAENISNEYQSQDKIQVDNQSQIESLYESMNQELYRKLAPEIKAIKNEHLEESITPFKRALEMITFNLYEAKADELSNEEALEKVLERQVERTKEIAQKRKKDYNLLNNREEILSKEKDKYDSERNKMFDLFNEGQIKLESLGKQYSDNLRVRDSYLEKQSSENYDGSVDGLLETTQNRIDELHKTMKKLNNVQKGLKDNVEDLVIKTKIYDSRIDKARVETDIAKNKYRQANLTYEIFSEMQGDKQTQQSIIGIFKGFEKDDQYLQGIMSTMETTDEFIDEIVGKYAHNPETLTQIHESIRNSDNVRIYSKNKSMCGLDSIEEARRMRYTC